MIFHHCGAVDRPDSTALPRQTLPLHSHSAKQQVWLELGGVGVALSFGRLIFAIWQASRRPAWHKGPARATIAGTTAAAVSVGLVSFEIWQQWFPSGLFIAAGLVAHAARQSAEESVALLPGAV